MEGDTLESGYVQPSLAARKYMTVPEKIELTEASGGVYSDSLKDQSGYKPMKVPDMITLETTTTTSLSPKKDEDLRNESQWGWDDRHGVPNAPPIRDETSDGPAPVSKAPSGVAELADDHLAIVDLNQRVRTLEQQVQRLRDVAVTRGGSVHSTKDGNRFWYVVTFAGWMMVPLIMAFMYRYRK